MKQREGRLEYGPGEQYLLRGLSVEEGDALDILVGSIWVSGYCITKRQMGTGAAMPASCRSRSTTDARHDFAWRRFTANRMTNKMIWMSSTRRMAGALRCSRMSKRYEQPGGRARHAGDTSPTATSPTLALATPLRYIWKARRRR